MPESPSNALEVTVTELSSKLKRTVEDTFGHVRVRGEISGFRGPHSSGHSYFSLKDDRARLEAVIWRGQAAKMKHLPEEGLEVIASGKLTTYPGSSKYQIVIDNLEPAGAGALMALLEERRKKLAAEGLFEDDRKQLLPFMPKVIAVVTSPTGAVIRDIMHRLNDRFPVHVLVWPVRVQGESSGREVANGVYQLNNLPLDGPLPRPDVIIVARGGGSLEDLWGFNDEALVRAVAGSMIPVISAVGHETDWTLIDYAADWRAPTPTAAAERAVPVKADLEAYIADLAARLRSSMSRLGERRSSELRGIGRGLKTPEMLLAIPRRAFDDAAGRLDLGLRSTVQNAKRRFAESGSGFSSGVLSIRLLRAQEQFGQSAKRHQQAMPKLVETLRQNFQSLARQIRIAPLEQRLVQGHQTVERSDRRLAIAFENRTSTAQSKLERSWKLLNALSYKAVLDRGFAVLQDENGQTLTRAKGQKPGSRLNIVMHDGNFGAVVETSPSSRAASQKAGNSGNMVNKSSKPKPQAEGTKSDEVNQGDLF